MKHQLSKVFAMASLGAAVLVAQSVLAEVARPGVVVTPAPAPTAVVAPSTAPAAPVRVARGMDEVLKLSRAQVSEDTILSYVRNSPAVYNLTAKDIVYLHEQGVSDRVVSTMLECQAKVVVQASQAPLPAPPPASAYRTTPAPAATAPTYVQSAPSTVYVTPPAPTTYYYAQPYYYPAYRDWWWWPPVSLNFGFGFGHGHGLR